MEIVELIPDEISFYTIATLIITILFSATRTLIDQFNITSFEKKLLTPRKKFYIVFSRIGLYSLVVTLVTFLFSYEQLINTPDFSGESTIIIFILFLTLFIIIIFLCYLTYNLLMAITYVLGINYEYYLIDKDNNRWLILRTNHEGKIVASNKNKRAFFEKDINNNYEVDISISRKKIRFYNKKHKLFTTGLIISLVLFFFGLLIYYNFFNTQNVWINCCVIILLFLILFIATVMFFSKFDFDYYYKKNNSRYKLTRGTI